MLLIRNPKRLRYGGFREISRPKIWLSPLKGINPEPSGPGSTRVTHDFRQPSAGAINYYYYYYTYMYVIGDLNSISA